MNSNYCVCCGAEIPEGRQVCPSCEAGRTPRKGKRIKIVSGDRLDWMPLDRLNDDSRLKDRWRD